MRLHWSLPDAVSLNPNKKNKQDSQAASNDGDVTQWFMPKLPEQQRLDGAGDGSGQAVDAARQYGCAQLM